MSWQQILDLFGKIPIVGGAIKSAIQALFDFLRDWIWNPLRPWFDRLTGGSWDMLQGASRLPSAMWTFAQRVANRFDSVVDWMWQELGDIWNYVIKLKELDPWFIAHWITISFLHWIEDIANLVDDYIDRHWDE